MRQDVYEFIESDQDLLAYLRQQPIWYHRLSRNPQDLRKMEAEAKYYFKKSIPDRVNQLSNGVQMASMVVSMLNTMASE